MAIEATHPGDRTVTASGQFRRTTGNDMSAHKSVPKQLSKRFHTNCFCIFLVIGTGLKNIQGLVFLFKVHPGLPRPMLLRSDRRNTSWRKEAYKWELKKIYSGLELKNDRLLVFALEGLQMMSFRLRTLCRRMNNLELLNKELLFHTYVRIQIFITCANIYTIRVGLLHTQFK